MLTNRSATCTTLHACAAHDKIAGRKNEASSVTAASRISNKALQAMLVGGWQPAELQAAANDEGGGEPQWQGDLLGPQGCRVCRAGFHWLVKAMASPGCSMP